MAISFIEPAERAWARTRALLFRPADVGRWIVLGFAAFLAGVAGQWAGLTVAPRWGLGFPPDWDDSVRAPFAHLLDFVRGSSGLLCGLPVALGLLAFGLLLLWVSSRGKLVFLDQMVCGHAAFVEPWKRYGRLGNSLFLWRVGFWLIALLIVGGLLSPAFWLGRSLSDSTLGRPFGALVAFGTGGALILGVVAAYVSLFLESFVVPLMYRDDVTAVEAWRRLLVLLRARPTEFLTYGIVVLLACVALFLSLLAAGVATCCILPLLLSVPFLRSLLLLPVSGFFRLYSVEFIAQFGPQYVVGAAANDVPTEPYERPGDPAT